MSLISKIVRQALATGYLTVDAEEQLRQQLQMTKYGLEDFESFITLQKEVMEGRVKQQARELWRSQNRSAAA
jgi:DNA-dependent RNA polymerase auxiliary subunit epsilon